MTTDPNLILAAKKFEPVGHCIYCGSTDLLSDEHIVPYALGGNLELPKASCEKCRKITAKFEGRVLRGSMWAVRTILNVQSRRPHARPTKGKLTISRDGKEEIVWLPITEYPVALAFPIFAPPTVFGGNKVSGINVQRVALIQFGGPPLAEVKERFGADDAYVTQTYKVMEFARLIAKIVYSFAFALEAEGLIKYEESPVVRAILGETEDIGHWVGSYTDPLEALPGVLHDVKILRHEDLGLIAGQIKLFADSQSPRYGAILGKLKT